MPGWIILLLANPGQERGGQHLTGEKIIDKRLVGRILLPERGKTRYLGLDY